jgi:septal ring factor EnvC (AmiA/AmiB activator)
MVHNSKRFSANLLHEKILEIIKYLSLTQEQIIHVEEFAKTRLEESLSKMSILLDEKNRAYKEASEKLDKLEERLLKDEIEVSTYKKWFRKYSSDRATLQEDIKDLRSDHASKWVRLRELFPYLNDLLECLTEQALDRNIRC